jgi:hypothetical protein
MLRTLFSATILVGALTGRALAPDAGCALPSDPEGIPAALDAAITGPPDKDRDCMKAPLIPEVRMIFVSFGRERQPIGSRPWTRARRSSRAWIIPTCAYVPGLIAICDKILHRRGSWSILPNKLLSYVSQYVTLLPDDVIFTGTPGKTQAVTHGDTIEIEGVGQLRNSVAVR